MSIVLTSSSNCVDILGAMVCALHLLQDVHDAFHTVHVQAWVGLESCLPCLVITHLLLECLFLTEHCQVNSAGSIVLHRHMRMLELTCRDRCTQPYWILEARLHCDWVPVSCVLCTPRLECHLGESHISEGCWVVASLGLKQWGWKTLLIPYLLITTHANAPWLYLVSNHTTQKTGPGHSPHYSPVCTSKLLRVYSRASHFHCQWLV